MLLDTVYVMPNDTLTVPVVAIKRSSPPAVVSFEAPSNPAYSIDARGKITALAAGGPFPYIVHADALADTGARSEEHTSELQSQSNLVCRLLLEKKKNKI